MEIKQVLIHKINTSYWWHVTPQDPDAYRKRGKFFASTYKQAEFYGKPNNVPEKVKILNPLWSDSEIDIIKVLFPDSYQEKYKSVSSPESTYYYKNRITLDGQMHKQAKEMGYDAIVLLGATGIKELERNRKPRSIELNLST